MARASTLTTAEVRLIKAMLLLKPRPTDQVELRHWRTSRPYTRAASRLMLNENKYLSSCIPVHSRNA